MADAGTVATALAGALVWGVVAILLWIAVTDWHERRIANRASAALLCGFALYALAAAMDPGAVLVALLCGLVAFLLGFALFALGQMGAGDVKLLGALVPWLGVERLAAFAVDLAVGGAALTLALLVLQRATARGAAAVVPVAPLVALAPPGATGPSPDPTPHPGARLPSAASPGRVVPPVLVTVLMAALLAGPGAGAALQASRALAASGSLAPPLVPAATLVALLFGMALALGALFLVLAPLGAAPPLSVADPDTDPDPGPGADTAAAAEPVARAADPAAPARGPVETPYGIAIAAAALATLAGPLLG